MRILVVEDEAKLADVIATRLRQENYAVDVQTDGESGLYDALTDSYDLLILDIMLPHVNGMEILAQAREEGVSAKIIMLTAKSTIEDKLGGLTGGANDYVTKPFHMDELVARVNILLRGAQAKSQADLIKYGDLELHLKSLKLTCVATGEDITLSNKEFMIVEQFAQNAEHVLSKEQIYDNVWGYDNEVESNNLEAYLSFIRRKLKVIGSKVAIKAVRGVGYRLEFADDKA